MNASLLLNVYSIRQSTFIKMFFIRTPSMYLYTTHTHTHTHTRLSSVLPWMKNKQTNKNGKSLLKSSGIGLFYIIALRNVNNFNSNQYLDDFCQIFNLMKLLPPIFNKNCLTLCSYKDNMKSKYRTRFHKSKSTSFFCILW